MEDGVSNHQLKRCVSLTASGLASAAESKTFREQDPSIQIHLHWEAEKLLQDGGKAGVAAGPASALH